jgi:hypothetical protein
LATKPSVQIERYAHWLAYMYGTRILAEKKRNYHQWQWVYLKISFLLIIGIYVTYFVYDGFGDIYTKASVLENFIKKTPSEV